MNDKNKEKVILLKNLLFILNQEICDKKIDDYKETINKEFTVLVKLNKQLGNESDEEESEEEKKRFLEEFIFSFAVLSKEKASFFILSNQIKRINKEINLLDEGLEKNYLISNFEIIKPVFNNYFLKKSSYLKIKTDEEIIFLDKALEDPQFKFFFSLSASFYEWLASFQKNWEEKIFFSEKSDDVICFLKEKWGQSIEKSNNFSQLIKKKYLRDFCFSNCLFLEKIDKQKFYFMRENSDEQRDLLEKLKKLIDNWDSIPSLEEEKNEIINNFLDVAEERKKQEELFLRSINCYSPPGTKKAFWENLLGTSDVTCNLLKELNQIFLDINKNVNSIPIDSGDKEWCVVFAIALPVFFLAVLSGFFLYRFSKKLNYYKKF